MTEKQNKPIREIKLYECQNQQSATFRKRMNALVSSATAKRAEGPHEDDSMVKKNLVTSRQM